MAIIVTKFINSPYYNVTPPLKAILVYIIAIKARSFPPPGNREGKMTGKGRQQTKAVLCSASKRARKAPSPLAFTEP